MTKREKRFRKQVARQRDGMVRIGTVGSFAQSRLALVNAMLDGPEKPPRTLCVAVLPDGTFHAVDNVCPHAGGSLAHGTLIAVSPATGADVGDWAARCPEHGCEFRMLTGEALCCPDDGDECPPDVRRYHVRIHADDSVWVGER